MVNAVSIVCSSERVRILRDIVHHVDTVLDFYKCCMELEQGLHELCILSILLGERHYRSLSNESFFLHDTRYFFLFPLTILSLLEGIEVRFEVKI